jgi:hypothetical protein
MMALLSSDLHISLKAKADAMASGSGDPLMAMRRWEYCLIVFTNCCVFDRTSISI